MTDAPESPADRAFSPEAAVIMEHVGMGALGGTMGIELLEADAARVVGRMPVQGNTQPFGLLHGGASAVLAEQLGSMAAVIHAGPGRIALGIELNVSHHRAVRDGFVTGTATALNLGRTTATYDVTIVDDEGRRVATARLTCVLRDLDSK